MSVNEKIHKTRRTVFCLILFLLACTSLVLSNSTVTPKQGRETNAVLAERIGSAELAVDVLERIRVAGRAPKTGYSRSEFGNGWATVRGCDMRNRMLQEALQDIEFREGSQCLVQSGTLKDPYTAETIYFIRGEATSDEVQIDHVVALSDAWQKGAQQLTFEEREIFANDPLNLIAVSGEANQEKGDSDAASWLPPNKAFRCQYVARQITVKDKYRLWITEAEEAAMRRQLSGCGEQVVPVVLP